MKRLAILLVITLITTAGYSQNKDKPLKTAGEIDLKKLAGTWYEISRFPNALDKKLTGVLVNYNIGGNKINEIFIGYKGTLDGKQRRIKSTLTYLGNGYIKGPLGKKYAVLEVGDNYEYFVMGTVDRKYMWVMSKKRTLDMNTYNRTLAHALDQGYETTKVELMKQTEE